MVARCSCLNVILILTVAIFTFAGAQEFYGIDIDFLGVSSSCVATYNCLERVDLNFRYGMKAHTLMTKIVHTSKI